MASEVSLSVDAVVGQYLVPLNWNGVAHRT